MKGVSCEKITFMAPKTLYRRFKALAATERIAVGEVLRGLMEGHLDLFEDEEESEEAGKGK